VRQKHPARRPFDAEPLELGLVQRIVEEPPDDHRRDADEGGIEPQLSHLLDRHRPAQRPFVRAHPPTQQIDFGSVIGGQARDRQVVGEQPDRRIRGQQFLGQHRRAGPCVQRHGLCWPDQGERRAGNAAQGDVIADRHPCEGPVQARLLGPASRVRCGATVDALDFAAHRQFGEVAPDRHLRHVEPAGQFGRRHEAVLADKVRDAGLAHATDQATRAGCIILSGCLVGHD